MAGKAKKKAAKAGSNIAVAEAPQHAWGYAIGLDMTRRDLQTALKDKGRPWPYH